MAAIRKTGMRMIPNKSFLISFILTSLEIQCCTANSTGVQYKSSIICANPAFFLSVFLSVRFYHNTKQCDLHYLFIHSGRLTHNIRLFAKIIVQQLSSVDTDIYLCWRKGDLKKDLHFPENHIYYQYTDIFTSSESF